MLSKEAIYQKVNVKKELLSTRGGIGGRGRLMICLACRELCSWDSGIEAAETRDWVTQNSSDQSH